MEVSECLRHLEQQYEALPEEVDADCDLHCCDHDLWSFIILLEALIHRDEVFCGHFAVEEEDGELLLALTRDLGADLAGRAFLLLAHLSGKFFGLLEAFGEHDRRQHLLSSFALD